MSSRAAAIALLGAGIAHGSRLDARVCAAGDYSACVAVDHVEPAWVKAFSTAAAGPEQLWINYGASPDTMAVRWLTALTSAPSVLHWGLSAAALPNAATGASETYTYGPYTSGAIHTVNITGLPLKTQIFYQVGDASTGLSAVYSFTSSPGVGPALYPYTTAFVADVGESNSANDTITHVLAVKDLIDSVVINGDISYASGCEGKSNCTTWDAFGRMTHPLSSIKPWMVTIGNHEEDDKGTDPSGKLVYASSSTYRFRGMPTGGRNDDGTGLQYFSWEVGPVHFLSVNSFYKRYTPGTPLRDWVASDLAAIDYAKTPWVVVSLHAPWYNSNTEHQGNGEPARLGLESLFITAGVSAVFSGHVHAYERSCPVNNNTCVPAGPGSMVHLNIGDGGAGLYTKWISPIPPWSLVRNATWGHGRWTVVNATHSLWTWHQNAHPSTDSQDATYILNGNPRVWA